ncbi:MAG: M20/M25/M40 family metallo-hydrolase [Acutalibacteraceae bacterium]|nr:M20/M25/M40 family metallo-hydrolase [Acutalibacteraceae bacterium]
MKYAFIISVSVILIFIGVLIFNALKVKIKSRKLTNEIIHKTKEEQTEYAQKLGEMIRCETVSKKDEFDDTEFKKLRETVEKLFPLVHEKCERMVFSDDCWIYKLKGKDESRNIMVMSHHDVVEAKGDWLHPGFCGEIFDDALWGRGAVDTKTPLFAEFQALEELLNEGFIPETNLFIGSSHNEEIAGDGIPTALKYFEEQGIIFETILDEGGAIIDPPLAGMKCKCAMMAVHEKGIHRLICTAKEGNSHTGLAANVNTPVARMSAFITEVNSKNIFIRRLYPEVRAMFENLCPYTPFVMTILFSNIWCFGGLLKWAMPKLNAQAGAMIGTSCSFNEISGSRDDKKCTAKAMLRTVNDEDLKKDIEAIKKIAEKYGVEIENGENNEYHKPADMTKPAFAYTRNCIADIFPSVASAAYILPAGTDARHLSDICDCVIRFAPIEMDSQQFASVHSENENISLKAIGNAVAFYKHYMKNYK